MHAAQSQSKDSILSQQLDSVLVNGQVSEKTKSSFQSARLHIADYENPQVTTTLGTKLTQNRNYYTQTSMLSNATGVTPSWAGVAPYFSIRGFRTRSNFRNGLNAYLQYSDDNSNIQQLDVVKGPSGTLFGGNNVAFGGLINVVTYTAIDSIFANFSIAAGSNAMRRSSIEINTVLDSRHKALLRIFGTYSFRESFQDQGLSKNLFLSPSFDYQLTPKLKLRLESEFLNKAVTNNPLFSPANPMLDGKLVNIQHTNELALDYLKSYTDNSLLWKTTSINFYGKITYSFSDKWLAETNIVSTYGTSSGFYQTNSILNNNTSISRKVLQYDAEDISNRQLQQNFTGKFSIGTWDNKILIGLDYNRYNYTANYKNAGYLDTVLTNSPSQSRNLFNADVIRKIILAKQKSYTSSPQHSYAVYVSDVVKPYEALSIMLSARYERLNNSGIKDIVAATTAGAYDQTSITPKIGLTYQLLPKAVTFFANYMSGFQNIAPTSINGTVYNFKPQYGIQWETGIKLSTASHVIDATFSYYNINVRNTLMTNPQDATKYIQDGKQFSRGLEFDIQSQPFQNLFIHTGAAYNDSKITAANSATQGLRPVNSGPKWSATGYVNYALKIDNMNKIIVGFGGNYIGQDLIINSNTAGRFLTDSYSIFNGSIGYYYKQFFCNLTADNLFNKQYYYGGRGFITQGNLRQCILSLRVLL